MQKKCKKMQDYLHMSKKSSTFAADLGIVPDRTIKTNRVMKKECVFKIEYKGDLYKVIKHPYDAHGKVFVFKVMHQRRVLCKFKGSSDKAAIESAMMFAFGVGVTIESGIVL